MSPSFRNENMLQFEALLLVGLIAAGALLRRRRIVEGLWIVFFAHMALASVRHVPVYVTVVGPVIAFEMAGWWKAWTAGAAKKSLPGIINQMAADSAPGFRRTSVWPFAWWSGWCRPALRSPGLRIFRTLISRPRWCTTMRPRFWPRACLLPISGETI